MNLSGMGAQLGPGPDAGTGIDPVTGGTITCNPGDVYDPSTGMCSDTSSDAAEYYGTLTLPATPETSSAEDTVVSSSGCPSGQTCTIFSSIPDWITYLGLGVAAYFLFFKKGGGGGF